MPSFLRETTSRKGELAPLYGDCRDPVARSGTGCAEARLYSKSNPLQLGMPLYFFSSSSPLSTRIAPEAIASISNSPG